MGRDEYLRAGEAAAIGQRRRRALIGEHHVAGLASAAITPALGEVARAKQQSALPAHERGQALLERRWMVMVPNTKP